MTESKLIAMDICILRLSSIGDVCHAIAVVQQIQRHLPRARITWIAARAEASLLKNLPNIRVIEFDKNGGLSAYAQLYRTLKSQHFDVLLHMQIALRASLASLCVRAKRRIGFDKARAREMQWLFTNETIEPQSEPHVLDGFWGFAKKLNVPQEEARWTIPLQQSAQQVRTKIGKENYVVLSASASNHERNWNLQGYHKLVSYLYQQGFKVVLTSCADKKEVSFANKIQQHCPLGVVNLAGQTNLQELLALIQGARFVVSPDSGPVHLSVCMDTPVIGLYAHSNPLRTGPYRFRSLTVSHYEKNVLSQFGKQSSQLRWGQRVKGHSLMSNISFDEVRKKVDALVQQLSPSCGTAING